MRPPARRRWILAAAGALLLVAAVPVARYQYHRFVLKNFETVIDGRVYRSAQPEPRHLREWTREHGIRTVINLRGVKSSPTYREERRTAEELGLRLVDMEWSAQRMPGRDAVRAIVEALETAEQPVLIHCARGQDRTGVASAIAAMALGGEDYDTAREHLSSKYAGMDDEARGVVGLMVEYEEHCRREGRSTGGWPEFRRWIDEVYGARAAPAAVTGTAGPPAPPPPLGARQVR